MEEWIYGLFFIPDFNLCAATVGQLTEKLTDLKTFMAVCQVDNPYSNKRHIKI